MPIVFCSLELHFPYCQSLKEKRNLLRKTAGRLRSRFNFSVAELDYQETWQRGRLGAVSVGSDRRQLMQISEKLVEETERIVGSDLVRYDIEFFEHD